MYGAVLLGILITLALLTLHCAPGEPPARTTTTTPAAGSSASSASPSPTPPVPADDGAVCTTADYLIFVSLIDNSASMQGAAVARPTLADFDPVFGHFEGHRGVLGAGAG